MTAPCQTGTVRPSCVSFTSTDSRYFAKENENEKKDVTYKRSDPSRRLHESPNGDDHNDQRKHPPSQSPSDYEPVRNALRFAPQDESHGWERSHVLCLKHLTPSVSEIQIRPLPTEIASLLSEIPIVLAEASTLLAEPSPDLVERSTLLAECPMSASGRTHRQTGGYLSEASKPPPSRVP